MEKNIQEKYNALLKKRQQESKKIKEKNKFVSSNDSQLIDMINNFNEVNEYKALK